MSLADDWGGAREGAGRKLGSGSFGEPTTPLRVPESLRSTILEFLDAHRKGRPLDEDAVRPTMLYGIKLGRRRSIPVVGFSAEAGFGSPAEDYVEDRVDLNAHLIRQGHEAATFIVCAKGWSMVGAGIFDGDEILVDRAEVDKVKSGDIVVATINGDLVIKRLKIEHGKMKLVSDNPHYPERIIQEGETLEIWGVCTRCLHNLR